MYSASQEKTVLNVPKGAVRDLRTEQESSEDTTHPGDKESNYLLLVSYESIFTQIVSDHQSSLSLVSHCNHEALPRGPSRVNSDIQTEPAIKDSNFQETGDCNYMISIMFLWLFT